MSDCSRTTTGIAPLDDPASGQYQGVDRGLYPGATNARPAAHTNLGRYYANQVEPLDAGGTPSATGKIGFIGLGASDGHLIFPALMSQIAIDAHVRDELLPVDCCVDGRNSQNMANPTNPYWVTEIPSLLAAGGLTHAQVQVAALFSGRQLQGYPFPTNVDTLEADLITGVQNCLTNFPNLKLLYITCVPYGNYAGPAGEPHDFEQGFAFARLIARQINHDPVVECRASPQTVRVAPYLTWGFYPWTDGLNPRPSDGLIWRCGVPSVSDVKPDGHHPTAANGAPKLARGWIDLFWNDITTRGWFYEAATGTTPTPPSGGGGTLG